jgi:hypothetical protein
MKKSKILITVLTILSITFFISCNNQDGDMINQEKNIFKGINIKLPDSFLNKIKLFDYSNNIEESKISKSIGYIIDDSKELIKSDPNVTNITFNIRISDGEAIVSEIFMLNGNKIYKKYQFNKNTDKYQNVTSNKAQNSPDGPEISCPEGYTSLGKCSNLGDVRECISKKISVYMATHLSSIGDCANIQVSIGTFSTKVCGKTC